MVTVLHSLTTDRKVHFRVNTGSTGYNNKCQNKGDRRGRATKAQPAGTDQQHQTCKIRQTTSTPGPQLPTRGGRSGAVLCMKLSESHAMNAVRSKPPCHDNETRKPPRLPVAAISLLHMYRVFYLVKSIKPGPPSTSSVVCAPVYSRGHGTD